MKCPLQPSGRASGGGTQPRHPRSGIGADDETTRCVVESDGEQDWSLAGGLVQEARVRVSLRDTPHWRGSVANDDYVLFVHSGSHRVPSMCSLPNLAASSGVFPSCRATM